MYPLRWLAEFSVSGCEKKLPLPRQMNFISTTACFVDLSSVCQFQVVLCQHKYFSGGSNCAQSALQAQLAACSIRYGAKCIVPWNMFQLCYSSRWIITSHQTRKPCLMMFDPDVFDVDAWRMCLLVSSLCCHLYAKPCRRLLWVFIVQPINLVKHV